MRVNRRLHRPSSATVISIIALFVALGGTATAGYVITSSDQLGKNVVRSKQIKNKSVAYKDLSKSVQKLLRKSRGVSSLGGPIVSGTPGPQGITGNQGPAGDRGTTGAAGAGAGAAVRYAAFIDADGKVQNSLSEGGETTYGHDADNNPGVYTFILSAATTTVVSATATLNDPDLRGFIRTKVDNSTRTVTVTTGKRKTGSDFEFKDYAFNILVAGK